MYLVELPLAYAVCTIPNETFKPALFTSSFRNIATEKFVEVVETNSYYVIQRELYQFLRTQCCHTIPIHQMELASLIFVIVQNTIRISVEAHTPDIRLPRQVVGKCLSQFDVIGSTL